MCKATELIVHRRFFPFFIFFMLITSSLLPSAVFAHSSPNGGGHIVLGGVYDNNFTLTSDSGELFHLHAAAPGDIWEGAIVAKNETKEDMELSLLAIQGNASNDKLLDALDLSISKDGEIIYEGKYNTGNKPVFDYIKIKSGKTETFDVFVHFAPATGNDLQGASMSSSWVFDARIDGTTNNDGNASDGTPGEDDAGYVPGDSSTGESPEQGNSDAGSGDKPSSGNDNLSDSDQSSHGNPSSGKEKNDGQSVSSESNGSDLGEAQQDDNGRKDAPKTGTEFGVSNTKDMTFLIICLLVVVAVSVVALQINSAIRAAKKSEGGKRHVNDCKKNHHK